MAFSHDKPRHFLGPPALRELIGDRLPVDHLKEDPTDGGYVVSTVFLAIFWVYIP